MNIFKVLASGRKSFSEESASALLAWLFCPTMEHGLGANLLIEFLKALESKDPRCRPLFSQGSVENVVSPVLRTQDSGGPQLEIHLEKNVQTGFIDLVLKIESIWIAVENKIRVTSIHGNRTQLLEQYQGLSAVLTNPSDRIISVFLTPRGFEKSEIEEFSNLRDDHLREHDYKVLVAWEDAEDEANDSVRGNTPSIAAMLRRVLEKEARGEISPIPDYTRHTLKALLESIRAEFQGYPYSSPPGSSGLNPKTYKQLMLAEIRAMNEVRFVGIADGVAGLLRLPPYELQRRRYQSAIESMTGLRNWLTKECFLAIADWRLNGGRSGVLWDHVLPSAQLMEIVESDGSAVFIGVRGGASALERMSADEVKKKKWQVRTAESAPTSQWISGNEFLDILKKKEIAPISMAGYEVV